MQLDISFLLRACASALASAVLAACGGGGGDANIGGTVSGLGTGLSVVLQDNGGDTLTLVDNGAFAFATKLGSGSAYNVTVLTHPTGQTCTLSGATGTVDSNGADVTSVTVACISTSTLTGTVSGLASGTAVTLSNGTVLLPVAANGACAFPGVLNSGTSYTVSVATQPVGLTCTVTNGSGTITTNAPTPITVTCA